MASLMQTIEYLHLKIGPRSCFHVHDMILRNFWTSISKVSRGGNLLLKKVIRLQWVFREKRGCIRKDYRNKAAHVDVVLCDQAKGCYQQVVGKIDAYEYLECNRTHY